MIKKKSAKRYAIGTLAFIFSLSLIFGIAFSFPVSNVSASVSNANKMFIAPAGVEVKANQSLPDSFLDSNGNAVERDFDIGKSGTLLSATKMDSSISLAPTFAGDFEMTFRPYSEVSFADLDWNNDGKQNDYNRSDIGITQFADLRELAFDFIAQDGTSFTVVIEAGERYNILTPSARVEFGNFAIGYHYSNDDSIPNNTGLKNTGAYYTRIGGTTFCNVARRNGGLTSANSMPITFGFDSENMQVYVEHYGTANSVHQHRVVYDFDDPSNGLLTLKSFRDYTVKMRFTDIKRGSTANLIVYDINGQSMAGEQFTDNIGPETIVSARYNTIKGQKYLLPEPTAFDVIEGILDYNGNVSVTHNGASVDVYTKEGTKTTVYTKDCYFIANALGEYDISYTAVDSLKNLGKTKVISVSAFNTEPLTNFVMNGNYKGITEASVLGKGTQFTVYAAKAVSEWLVKGYDDYALVSLYKDSVAYGDLHKTELTEDKIITLNEAGNYKIVYEISGLSEQANKVIEFTVADTAPIYQISYTPTFEPVGSIMEVPTLWAELSNEKKRGTALLYDPNGNEVSISDGKALLNVVGEYKLSYLTRLGGSTYEYSIFFNVGNSNEGIFTSTSQYATASMGDSGNLYPTKATGVKLTYTAADTWIDYSRVIDLSKNKPDEPLIKVIVLPSLAGRLDFWQYTIRLTDIHNEKNYVDVTVFKGSWGNQFSYVRAGSMDQTPAGWENGKILTAYNTGCPICYSFTGETILGTETMNLYFDYQDLAVYVDNIKRPGYSYGNQVIDLNSLDCFSENMFFDGFTTGEVKLSLSIQYLQADSASILVTEVNGVSMAEKEVIDNESPRISIDTLGYSELPLGLIGTEYPIYNAEAFDSVDGRLSVNTAVYLDYQTANQKRIDIVNNKFLPTEAGEYSIVYTSKDYTDHITEKVVTVNVVENLPEFVYTFEEEFVTDYLVGKRMILPDGYAGGGSGNATASLALFDCDGKNISLDNVVFTKAGEYQLVIELKDFLERKQNITHVIEVTLGDSPILYNVTVAKYMINGSTYNLPAVEAVDYSSGENVAPETHIEVIYNGNVSKLEGTVYKPEISEQTANIIVAYVAKNSAGKEVRNEYSVTVLDVDGESGINKVNYFNQKDITSVAATGNYIEFATNKEGAKIDFANALIANNLGLEFYVPSAKNKFDAIKVTYIDSQSPEIAVSVYVKRNSTVGETSWFNCGGKDVELFGNFYDKTRTGFRLSYNNNSLYFIDKNTGSALDKVLVDDNGKMFKGFPSGKVFISYTFIGVSGDSAIQIFTIGNQGFDDGTTDRVAPQLQLLSELPTTADIGMPISVPRAIAADVLNPEVEITLTIKLGSETLYNGSIESIQEYTPTKYGEYQFIYTVKAGNRSTPVPYVVRVKDKIDPVLEILSALPDKAKVGQTIELPKASTSDNEATDIRVWIFITETNGNMYALGENTNSVTFKMKGQHTITYYIEDNYGNYVYEKCFITVE